MADTGSIFTMDPSDRDIAIRTMLGEEGDPLAQAGVASTMINRARTGQYGGTTLKSVALAPGQFEPWAARPQALMAIPPTSPAYQQAGQILDGVASGDITDPTGGATHFFAPVLQKALGRNAPSWSKGNGVSLGSTMFYAPNGPVAPTSAAMKTINDVRSPVAASDTKGTATVDPFSEYPTTSASPAPKTATTPDPFSEYPTTAAPVGAPAKGIGFTAAISEGSGDPFSEYPTAVAPIAAPTARMAGAAPIPGRNDGLVWNQTGGFDPKTGELVVGGKPPQELAPSQLRAGLAGAADIPIVGPSLISGAQKIGAGLRNLFTGDPADQTLSAEQAATDASTAAYPKTAFGGKMAGTALAMAPAMMAAPAAFGAGGGGLIANTLTGAATGAGIGAADNVARNGLSIPNAEFGAATGALGGAAGPLVGAGIGRAIGSVSNLLAHTTPEAGNAANMLRSASMTPADAAAEIGRMGPNATFADIHPLMKDEVQGIAALGGTPTAVLKQAMTERAAGADDNMAKIVEKTLGPKPDAQAILDQIKGREVAGTVNATTAKAALDNSMGPAVDPYDQLHQMLQTRSAAAQPLYEKAFQGGSMAPLETQFSNAFSDAANASSQAAKDLAAAQQQQLLARAKVSNAGDNVYASNSALAASRQADGAVSQAQAALNAAEQNKQSILGRLRQAQNDGSANAPGAVWNPRIQQFLDDPIMQSALAKGVRIQRLESLASGQPFNPTEYAITGSDAIGNPVVSGVPNMRTLNVAKKGLDSMVSEAQDPITGRLSEEGRAIDQVRRSFLGELDAANPDYKAARQAWAGPSQTQDAFNQGLGIFKNQGVNTTPGALSNFIQNASDGEKDAAKLGVRAAFNQQMTNTGDPAAKAAMLANKGAIQQKLAAVLGPAEADSLVKQLTFKYEDPVGQAFSKGMDIFKARQGVEGVQDSPDALKSWLKTATPAEIEAHQQGARQAIEQSLTSARQGDVSQARSLFAKSTANREKLQSVFPQAGDMLDSLDSELRKRATEQAVNAGSQTANKQAIRAKYAPTAGGPEINPAIPLLGEAVGGAPLAAGATAAKMVFGNLHNAFTEAARNRLIEGTARGLVATGPEQSNFLSQVGRAYRGQPITQGLATSGGLATNLLTRPLVQSGANSLFPPQAP